MTQHPKPLLVTKSFLPPIETYQSLLVELWKTSHLTNRGAFVQKFERLVAERLGVENVLALANGTLALQVAFRALGLKGDVITTPFSYVATTSSLVWEGLNPIFADIDERTYNLDPLQIEKHITAKTSAILATHVYGNPCDVNAIEKIANRYNLKVIYDAAHAFGVELGGKSVLRFGDASILSFHATKVLHTVEGGAIISNSCSTYEKAFSLHNFGHQGHDNFSGLGINGKLSEIHAAMGLANLPYLDEILERRKLIYEHYRSGLSEKLAFQRIEDNCVYNHAYVPVRFRSEDELLKVKQALEESNIFTRRYFHPSLEKLPFISNGKVPIADRVSKTILCLPTFFDLGLDDVDRTCDLIIKSLGR